MCCWDGNCSRCIERRDGRASEEALQRLRRKLYPIPTAVFTRTDGETVTIENVIVDSIGPSGDSPGVVAVETDDDREIVHVPFVAYWTITY